MTDRAGIEPCSDLIHHVLLPETFFRTGLLPPHQDSGFIRIQLDLADIGSKFLSLQVQKARKIVLTWKIRNLRFGTQPCTENQLLYRALSFLPSAVSYITRGFIVGIDIKVIFWTRWAAITLNRTALSERAKQICITFLRACLRKLKKGHRIVQWKPKGVFDHSYWCLKGARLMKGVFGFGALDARVMLFTRNNVCMGTLPSVYGTVFLCVTFAV